MKFIVSLVLMMLLAFAACLFLPWWSIAVTCFLVSVVVPQKKWLAFLTGFLSVFILWGGLSFYLSFQNNHLLAHKISPALINADSPFGLIALTGLVGALVGAFAALSGSFLLKGKSRR